MEKELNNVYSEGDLLLYCQILRLKTDKKFLEDNMNRSKKVEEEKTTFNGFLKNLGHSIERGLNDYETKLAKVIEQIDVAESVDPKIKIDYEAKKVVNEMFKDDHYDLARLLFASSVILDDEFKYIYKDEGLKEVSELIYGNRFELLALKDKLEANFNKIAPKSLSNVQKGLLATTAALSLTGVFILPVVAVGGVAASAATTTAALAAFGITDMQIGAGTLALGALLVGATATGAVYGSMKLYNNEKVKQSFKKLTADEQALYLAIQCTYIQMMKEKLEPEEFKAQLDEILKTSNNLKSDLDYYLFVENEDKESNILKEGIFHQYDKRLIKILGLN